MGVILAELQGLGVEVALNSPQKGGDFFRSPLQGEVSLFPRVSPHVPQGPFFQLPLPQLQSQGDPPLQMEKETVRRAEMKLGVHSDSPGSQHPAEARLHFPSPGKQNFVHPPLIVG